MDHVSFPAASPDNSFAMCSSEEHTNPAGYVASIFFGTSRIDPCNEVKQGDYYDVSASI